MGMALKGGEGEELDAGGGGGGFLQAKHLEEGRNLNVSHLQVGKLVGAFDFWIVLLGIKVFEQSKIFT